MPQNSSAIGKMHAHRFHEDERRRGFYDIVPGLSGDMNFTHIEKGSIAGLHLHKKHTDYFAVARGAMLFRLITEAGEEERIVLSAYSQKTLSIPPNVWHGYKALEDSILLSYTDQKYDPDDEFRRETGREDWESEIK